ncbi:ubiquitin carboxyl-terminal hydrolase 18-like isoform X2 [Phoenix dactylifera]|uniref:Ubiquitin carboxyl-terminal hydrolase 18-like isoform X2 n=1 Tax=Phoenix dactylifera TaxID=42345 RepID=A0A8B7C1F8_PHODC|nr:ubiquitin carboxyl-terminal hydrolase 18-like isoform X2 [Phoenix dactylifera]
MLIAAGLLALDLSSLLQFVLAALLILAGALLLVRKAASRYFVVDASFETATTGYEARRQMSIGGESSGGGDVCASCGSLATKKCSRCKSVRYCSQACQSKHWEAEHKHKCKQIKLLDKAEVVSSGNGACRRRKSSGFSSISLVPAQGTCKVLHEPKKILFPYDEFVELFNWAMPGFPPCGLVNCGNSCFANVVLQCLTCTRPLVAYLLERDHSRGCFRKRDDWCFLCELQVHVQRASKSSQPFQPMNILNRLPNIGGNLGYGRQEDAHEFMRFAIDTMQSICLDEFGGEKALDPSTQETTLIQHIFGGHLQSQVICTNCNEVSNRYENMMDLTVEIQGDAESLEECLDQFTVKEWLDGENKYKCDGCNDYVKAWKRLTVHQPPNILTIALKRFQSGRFGKLNKRITFPENLDLTPYMSGNGDGTDLYSLYAVVVHLDMLNASFFGHYVCYTKDYHGHWYRIDDCKVLNVEVEEVLAQGAYMLLYCRKTARREPFVKPVDPPRQQLSEANPKLSSPSTVSNSFKVSCLPSDVDSKPNSIEASLLKNTGPEKISSEGDFIKNRELEDMETDAPAKELPSVEIHTVAEPCVCSDLESHMEEDNDGSTGIAEASKVSILDLSVTGQNIGDKIADPSSAVPTINSSLVSEPSDDLRPESEQAVAACSPSGSANGISRLDDTSFIDNGNKGLPSCWENGYRSKPKPLFSRGFLDRPARKKSVDSSRQNHTGSHGVALVPRVNGYCNGHSDLGLSEQDYDNCSASLKSSCENGRGIIRGDMSFKSRGFLRSSYTKSSDEEGVKKTEMQKFDYRSKPKCNGSVEQASVDKLDFRPEAYCSNGIDFTKINHEEFRETAFVHENGSKVYKKDGPLTPALQNMNVGLGDLLKPPSGCLNEHDM